jgi:tRNA threonylcarbamoyladenosine biosynthesis protein TsaE
MRRRCAHCAAGRAAYFPFMVEFSLELPDETATARLGAGLAARLRGGDVVALSGPLGAGKSTLARAIIAALTGVMEAPSPTFTLVETYETRAFSLWHFDLYRLEKAEDVWELGYEDALDGVSLIEWPERIERMLPPETLLVRLSVDGDARRVLVRGDDSWGARLAGLNPA